MFFPNCALPALPDRYQARRAVRYTGQVVISALLIFVHVIVCLFLIVVVLLQSGKAADLAGAFGGMGSQTAFGPRGSATLLSKATTISAIVFMLTSISLSIVATRESGRRSSAPVLQRHGGEDDGYQPAPATPQPAQNSRRSSLTTTRPSIAEVAELADALA